MSLQNKTILEHANAAIADGDIEGFLVHCTEDVQWTTVGGPTLQGKAAVRRWMQENYVEPPIFSVSDLVADGDMVVALGEIQGSSKDGERTRSAYADVWRFRDGRMSALQAFVVELPAA